MSASTLPAAEQRTAPESGAARAQLGAARLAVLRRPLLVPAAAALGLSLLTLPWQDTHGVQVMHGVAILLACALCTSTDDPAGEVVAAAPVPRRRRTLTRVAAALAVVLPILVLASGLARARHPGLPVAVLLLESVGYAVLAVTVGAGLRAWAGLLNPAYPAVVGLLLLVLASDAMPRWYVVVDPQPWGPPYDGALIRWAALIVVALGVLALALRDPAE